MEFDDDALERTLDAFSDRAPPLKITSLSPNIATGRAYRPRPPPEPAQSSAATRIEDAGAACASQHRSTRRLGEVARSAAQRVFRDTKHGLAVRIPTRTALARGHEPDKTPRKPCSSRQTHSDSAGLRSRWSEVRILWGAPGNGGSENGMGTRSELHSILWSFDDVTRGIRRTLARGG